MLTKIVKEKNRSRADTQVGIKKLREQLTEDAVLMNQGFLNASNRSVLKIHAIQIKIHSEVNSLQKETTAFVKQTTKWNKQLNDLNKNMELLGDIEIWAKNVESDLKTITSALHFVVDTENKSI